MLVSSRNKTQYQFISLQDRTNIKDAHITGSTISDTLENILTDYTKRLNDTKTTLEKYIAETTDKTYKSTQVSQEYRKLRFDVVNAIKNVSSYYKQQRVNNVDDTVLVNSLAIQNDILSIRKSYDEQKNNLDNVMETKMNEVIKSSEGIGFNPTIRNVFAVILANADVFIKLMKDVVFVMKEGVVYKKP